MGRLGSARQVNLPSEQGALSSSPLKVPETLSFLRDTLNSCYVVLIQEAKTQTKATDPNFRPLKCFALTVPQHKHNQLGMSECFILFFQKCFN
jgi:hypothetical protein